MIIDSHCHLQFNAYKNDVDEVVKRCNEHGVICNIVGTQSDTSASAVVLAEKHENLYATIGLHPIHITSTEVDEEEIIFKSREEEFDEKIYDKIAKSKKVIAVGECGIELFHLPPDADKKEILEKQTKQFLRQYEFANKHSLPLVIHVRDAYDEMLEVLEKLPKPIKGVMHCYSGNWTQAQKYLDVGLYLGFTGVVTFPPRKTNPQATTDLLEVIKNIPNDKFLIETDAPYLAPQAYRGQRCEPWMVVEVARKIAEIKGFDLAEVIKMATDNTLRLFTKINP